MRLPLVFRVVRGIAVLLVLTSCQQRALDPVAIEATDMCSFCRMTISDKRYAAELIDDEERVFKFDDIGCMTNFIKQNRNDVPTAALFVMDFESREWMKAEDAFYVRSAELKTPMSHGLAAFKNKSSAETAVAKYNGALLRFAEITQ